MAADALSRRIEAKGSSIPSEKIITHSSSLETITTMVPAWYEEVKIINSSSWPSIHCWKEF